ncbi:MAG: RrF2 family transcriptional regulator [Flavisolibacter sp.]
MNNGRLATSIHILTLLAKEKNELLSSEYLANSININPVLVRKELSNLRQHGLIESKEGKGGGSTLAKPAREILMADVFKSVRQSPLLGRSHDTNNKCPIGKQINEHIDSLYEVAEEAMIKKLEKMTLADFCKQFN